MSKEEKKAKERVVEKQKVSLTTACSITKMSKYTRGAAMKAYRGEGNKTLDRWKEIFKRDKLI